jgi:GT2 family glycosyltransferase
MPSSSSSGPDVSVSVVVPSHGEGDNLRRTVHSLLATLPPDGEIVVVDDASDDGSADFLEQGCYGGVRLLRPATRLGAPAARNQGAAASRGALIVFCDAHVELQLGWYEPLAEALARPEAGAAAPVISVLGKPDSRGFGFTWCDAALNVRWLAGRGGPPRPVPMLPGCFLAMRRDVFDASGGWDAGVLIWGGEDQELSLRLWSLGYDCLLVPEVAVAHRFRNRFPYEIDWELVLHNKLRLGSVHFGRARLARLVGALARSQAFPAAFARLLDSDVWDRRAQVRRQRARDEDWFFERFAIDALG